MRFDAPRRELRGDDVRSAVFLEAEFRVRVQIAAQTRELVVIAADVGDGIVQAMGAQCAATARSMRRRGSTA